MSKRKGRPPLSKNISTAADKQKVEEFTINITGISYGDIYNLHFNEVSTVISSDRGIISSDREIISSGGKCKNEGVIPSWKSISMGGCDEYEKVDNVIDNSMYAHAICFLDSKKNRVKIWPIMIDQIDSFILPFVTKNPCRNCHHPISTPSGGYPLGCPIRYFPDIPLNDPKRKKIEDFWRDNNFSSPDGKTDYFETEHMFCSIPCIKSYIISCLSKNPLSVRYSNSLSYLTLMYAKLHSIEGKIPEIKFAHPISSLKAYGGYLFIEEYRDESQRSLLKFDETINVQRPIMFASFPCIEELKS